MNLKLHLTALLITILLLETTSSLRILGVFPIPGRSHYTVGEYLMRGLAERGHKVDVYNHFPTKKPIPNFTDYNLDGILPQTFHNNMSFDIVQAFSGPLFMTKIVESMSQACHLMETPIFKKLIDSPPKDPPYDLLIVEIFIPHCYIALGRHLNIPAIGVLAAPQIDWVHDPIGNPVNPATDPSLFSLYAAPMTFTERVVNFLMTNYIKFSFNRIARVQDEVVEKLLGKGYPSVVDMPKDLALMLINHHHAVHGIKPFTPAMVPIGGLHVVEPPEQLAVEVQKFLNESEHGFVYVSFGSMVKIETFPEPVVKAFYQTFEKIKPVRVLMKIANPKQLLPGIPSNVMTYHWLPQIKVLKHKNIKAFITHGGLMGTLESIHYGVPMIGFPLFGDQYLNVGQYVKKNLAIQLEYKKIDEPTFTKAVKEILQNPIYKKTAEKVSELFQDGPMSPMDTAAYWVEYIARHGKNALRSPLVDMPWWQSSLLDVYAFLIGCALLAFYVVKVVIRVIVSMVCPGGKRKVKTN